MFIMQVLNFVHILPVTCDQRCVEVISAFCPKIWHLDSIKIKELLLFNFIISVAQI